jgi:hypothetical protein
MPTRFLTDPREMRSMAGRFITQFGRNFQTIYEQANSHGQKVQTAGNNMSSTDSAVGSSWA